MNIEKLTKEIGSMDSAFIDEALDYAAARQRGGIRMNKKKILILAAVIAAIVCTFTAAAMVRDIFISRGDEYYYGSLDDGTAVNAEADSVMISAVNVDENIVKFIIEADTNVELFSEYTELTITDYDLYSTSTFLCGESRNPFTTLFGHMDGTFRGDGKGDLAFKTYKTDLEMYFEKMPLGGVMCDVQTYTLVVSAIAGRNADGDIIEIRGEWIVDFEF